jgi:hypothetical protein
MRAHAADAEVQYEGCEALWRLVNNHTANLASARAAGAADTVRTAMGRHPGHGGVQHEGRYALENL